jgi:hypothetical protein
VARNALKHGICAATVCLKSEDRPTFNLFLAEMERELQPRTVMQRILFDQIANAVWRLRRLPEAQSELFERELDLAADEEGGQTLSPAQVLAHRFSADRSNGFALMGRYEASLRNGLLRMWRQYESLKKHHATTPDDDDEPEVPREGAWSEERRAAQQKRFADRAAALRRHEPPRDEHEASIDRALWGAEQAKHDAEPGAQHEAAVDAKHGVKQSHSKPPHAAALLQKTRESMDRRCRGQRNKPIAQAARKGSTGPDGGRFG